MSVTIKGYTPSSPSAAAARLRSLLQHNVLCPMCGRVAKWYYNYYRPTSKIDSPNRCTLHEMSPIPGPADEPDHFKVDQLY